MKGFTEMFGNKPVTPIDIHPDGFHVNRDHIIRWLMGATVSVVHPTTGQIVDVDNPTFDPKYTYYTAFSGGRNVVAKDYVEYLLNAKVVAPEQTKPKKAPLFSS